MLTISKFELSKVYPFMSLSPVLVFIFGIIFLGEEFSWGKVIGLVLISVGLFVTVRY
jgi:undecaprenyl phosphate-alpha-L-ara4N flippase subunit ArnF